jgi:hypothetical protein
MKKLLQLILFIQFALLSCNSKTEKKTESKKSYSTEKVKQNREVNEIEENKTVKVDTAKIKKYAQQILENKISPSDDDETFECMNQLLIENQKDLDFYFNVFRVIVKKSDGALSEVIGQYVMGLLKSKPDFFIEQYSEFKLEEQQRFIEFMAYEFYFTEPEHIAEINQYFTEVNSRIKQNTEPKRKYLNSIKELTKVATEKIIEE